MSKKLPSPNPRKMACHKTSKRQISFMFFPFRAFFHKSDEILRNSENPTFWTLSKNKTIAWTLNLLVRGRRHPAQKKTDLQGPLWTETYTPPHRNTNEHSENCTAYLLRRWQLPLLVGHIRLDLLRSRHKPLVGCGRGARVAVAEPNAQKSIGLGVA